MESIEIIIMEKQVVSDTRRSIVESRNKVVYA